LDLNLLLSSVCELPLGLLLACIVHIVLRGFKQLHLCKIDTVGNNNKHVIAISSSEKLAPPVPKAIPKYFQSIPKAIPGFIDCFVDGSYSTYWSLCMVSRHAARSELGRRTSLRVCSCDTPVLVVYRFMMTCGMLFICVRMLFHAYYYMMYGIMGLSPNMISKSNGSREHQMVFVNAFHKHGILGYAGMPYVQTHLTDTSHIIMYGMGLPLPGTLHISACGALSQWAWELWPLSPT
jgi:hypothetical protein